jgi:acyl-CoA thioester hydrolase
VVYHGNYAQYFEMGRVEWLRNIGISYKWMEENGMLPVVSLNINYKKPARYDDLLTVKTIFKVRALLRSSLIMKFTTVELLTIASSILVL